MKSKKIQNSILWIIVLISVAGLFFAPKEELINQLKTTIPWLATGIIISEIILTIGFLLMLSIAAPGIIKKLLHSIRSILSGLFMLKETVSELEWSHVAKRCNESKVFWLGYWLSVVGACGDGVVIIWGIGRTLPPASWGLMILPFWDLGLTYIIRRAIYKGVKKPG